MPLHADHGPILPLVALGCRFQHSHRVNGIQVPPLPSLFEILKPAIGPSSSHTLGPMRAGQAFRRQLQSFTGPQPGGRIRVTLCECLAHTGVGPNAGLEQAVDAVHRFPYERGWLYEVDGQLPEDAMSATEYAAFLDGTIDRMTGKS